METRKQAIMTALDKFVAQRPGLEFGNYGDVKAYRAEMRSITKDLHHYRELARAVEGCDGIDADALLRASRDAYSGRLKIGKVCSHQADRSAKATCGKCGRSWCCDCYPAPSALCHHCNYYVGAVPDWGAVKIEYTTGQYFPTEYRRAACAVLASALWAYARENMPKPNGKITRFDSEGEFLSEHDNIEGKTPGDWLRAHFARRFGRNIAARWFN